MSLLQCVHKYINVPSLDGEDIDQLCASCGATNTDSEIMFYQNKIYPRTMRIQNGDYWVWRGLEKIMLPLTIKNNIRHYRDNFDKPLINNIRVFNVMLRTCEHLNIPKCYGGEAMRLMLKRNKGLYSKRKQYATLLEVITGVPQLESRITLLADLIKNASGI